MYGQARKTQKNEEARPAHTEDNVDAASLSPPMNSWSYVTNGRSYTWKKNKTAAGTSGHMGFDMV